MKKYAALLALALAAPALLAANAAGIIEAREANFKQMGKAFKGMNDEVKLATPSVESLKANSVIIEKAAARVISGFPKGSGPESGQKTHALPAVWEKFAEFKTDANNLRIAAKTLRVAAASGNLDATKAAMPAVGAACKACHQTFKARD
jgi:cytochrome c556